MQQRIVSQQIKWRARKRSVLVDMPMLIGLLLLSGCRPLVQGNDTDWVVKEVEKVGGEVRRDQNAPGNPVIEVRLKGNEVSQQLLNGLGVLPQLRKLYLSPISRGSLAPLSDLQHLTYLALAVQSDQVLESIGGLTRLESLDVSGNVTDQGIKHLRTLANLQSLDLSSTKVQGLTLGELKELKHLEAAK